MMTIWFLGSFDYRIYFFIAQVFAVPLLELAGPDLVLDPLFLEISLSLSFIVVIRNG